MRENLINKIDWIKCGELIPTVIQNARTLEVLMLGFMNIEALQLTQETGIVHFFSRTRGRIWKKGETSGNVLNVININIDCDNDTLLILVNPIGATCHTGAKSCFNTQTNFLHKLEDIIDQRISGEISDEEKPSYITTLHSKGMNKIAQKIGEEGVETAIAAINESDDLLLNESADLIFHLMIALRTRNLSVFDAVDVLKSRNG